MNNVLSKLQIGLIAYYEGKSFETNSFGTITVTKYVNAKEVHIKFANTGYETIVQSSHIASGNIKDRLAPSIHGVGVVGDAEIQINGKLLKEYVIWRAMLKRCYDSKSHLNDPTYKDCSVSDNFKYYPYFKDWCSKQVGFGKEGWQLDKDILVKGNKVYSEDTCCFVPKDLNSLLTHRKKDKGLYPVGVSYKPRINRYIAQIRKFKENIHLGCFATPDEAFCAYKEAKEAYIKEVAELYKDRIDPRVYEALMNYVVEITD
mgnify:CR=1 FL=1